MKRELLFRDEKSNKFWRIEVDGAEQTVSFGKVGTSGQRKVKSFGSPDEARDDAEKQVAAKLKKGYAEAGGEEPAEAEAPPRTNARTGLSALTAESLLRDYAWENLEGHGSCPALLSELEGAEPSAVARVIGTTLGAFTFVSGGGWCPDWIEKLGGKRHDGSGLVFLVGALEILRRKDEALWVTWATRALPFIVCEGEAIDHDEGESWEAYDALSQALAPHYAKAGAAFDADEAVASLARQLDAISRAHVRGDPLRTSLALLGSGIDGPARAALLNHLLAFVAHNDFGLLGWACSCGGLDQAACDAYAATLEGSPVAETLAGRLVVAALRQATAPGPEFKCGRANGRSPNDFYWFGIHAQQNDRCPIFHFDGQGVRDLGTFKRVPKVMCWAPDGLYFALGESIFRYDPAEGGFHHELDAGFELYTLQQIRDTPCAVGAAGKLCRKDAKGWRILDLGSDAKLCGLAGGPGGEVWVSGTQGTILAVGQDDQVRIIPPVDREKKTYWLASTEDGVYVRCSTGLYRADGKKPKAILKDPIQDAVFARGALYAATREELVRIEHDKLVERLPLETKFLGSLGGALALTVAQRVLLIDDQGVRFVTPAAPQSPEVALPKG
jgi:predicted DNA-binding WGR domain protein